MTLFSVGPHFTPRKAISCTPNPAKVEFNNTNSKTNNKTIPPFIGINNKGLEVVSVPLLADYVRKNLKYLLVKNKGNQALLIYVYEHGVYTLCDEDMFKGHIKKFVQDYDIELVKMRQINEAF